MATVEGIIEDIVYTNEVNGYTVCDIACGKDIITAVGYLPFVNVGETLRITGKWVMHPDYGKQLKVEYYEKIYPQTVEDIKRYLASGIIKGVGPATAEKIVNRFKEETLDVIRFRPSLLAEIKGISLEKAESIGQAFEEQRALTNIVMFLQNYGINAACSAKIYRVLGDNTIEKIKSNPYILVNRDFAINFKVADKIAMSLGIDPLSKNRITSCIKYVLAQAAYDGHTYLPRDILEENVIRLLGIGMENSENSLQRNGKSEIDNGLISLVLDKEVYIEKDEDRQRIYLSNLYLAELGVCKRILELASTSFNMETKVLEDTIEEIQREENIFFAEMQKVAIKEALSRGALVITGGPGTGKTTIIKCIIKIFNKMGYKVALAAPTGRAAKRMAEASGYEAKTIHRLLEVGYAENESELTFTRNEYNPIEADVIIVDEMSMVDILIMDYLLRAIAAGARLIMCGDVDQLPSVGPGNVLKDIISSGAVKTVRLNEIFRQAEESMITVNAHRINKGLQPYLNVREKDFFFINRNNGDDIVNTIIDLCKYRLPQKYGYDPMTHIQVLTPMRKGPLGSISLNKILQEVLNPGHRNKKEKAFGKFVFREGDKVMQIRNNYSLKWEKISTSGSGDSLEGAGVFNGDGGVIGEIDEEEQTIIVVFDDERIVKYDYTMLDEIEPAFSITVHKSQGSEFPVVIIPVFPGPKVLMTRNLLYTAITRAKELVVIVGGEEALNEMIKNERETLRYSHLGFKLSSFDSCV
ncbi:MAG TPA: ATP-dependent RecD-like DNA helicase [Clostridiaceae bacterium]|nr:ATP-dependent RecD-like DNA helicase [Clostridiaceae bacterium]